MSAPRRVAFLDRDGTLIHEPPETHQVDDTSLVRVLDGVVDGLLKLQRAGYSLVMVTNQDGLGTAAFPRDRFERPQKLLLDSLAEDGVRFDEVFVCPHTAEDGCGCRKPRLGLLEGFLERVAVDRAVSFVCGDRDSDRQLARNLGVEFVAMATNGHFGEVAQELERRGLMER